LMKQLIEIFELLDRPDANGAAVRDYFTALNPAIQVEVTPLTTEKGKTDFVRITIPGTEGKLFGGSAPTLGILGRLGGIGARPEQIGFVSDGDGAWTALSAAAKLADMAAKGERLPGDVVICTHICPDAPVIPHDPVPFLNSPVTTATVNQHEVRGDLDAILSIDTTKGNRIINCRGFAISPTVKEGYIMRVSDDLLDLMQNATGRLPQVFAITMQDISPYGNGSYHLNSIMQPCTATKAPVVGVAITTQTVVAGCATGASHTADVEEAAIFAVEVAKAFGRGKCQFYDEEQFALMQKLYGDMSILQTLGK
ncbi:MAG: DUF1177 domain-containing protein, partial [Lachnospiraceae bacterium]|nr:DUF1177 domain-containing protein [Lachnospiraceae bacterium]